MTSKTIKLGEVITLEKTNKISILNEVEYTIAGIQSYGQGVVNRRNAFGRNLNMKQYQVIDENQLMWCKVDTKNGQFGVTKKEHVGSLASTNMCLATINTDKILPEFLEKLFRIKFFHESITHLSSGTTNRKYLTPTQLCELVQIPNYNKEEQFKFLAFVNKLESSPIFKNISYQLTLVSNLNQAILQEAVQGKLVKQDKKEEPASELLKRIKAEKAKSDKKEKPLPPIKPEEIPFEIPENWVWCRLGEITDYGSSPKAEPSDLKNDIWVLDLEDIEKTTSNLLCKIRFNERNSLSTKSVFKSGDVLYSKLRPYLDKVIVADEDGVCTTEILPLKCYASLNPYYFKYSLKRVDFLKYVNSVTKGMKMPRLGTKEGQHALIPLPPLPEQERIVAEIEKQLAKTKQLKEHIIANQQATEQLLKALLHQAFLPVPQAGEVEEMVTV